MDVKFINPFLYGTTEVMEKMAFTKPTAGKPYAKVNDRACGDVSGIIGMTGDATGSLAISFSESCILGIVSKMFGEKYVEMNREVFDAVGELTNMISGSSRKLMEKDDLKVFAAIPTIVFGRAHTIYHVIKGPSIVIPFETEFGQFVIDVCLKSNIKQKRDDVKASRPAPSTAAIFEKHVSQTQEPALAQRAAFDPKAHNPAVFGVHAPPKKEPDILQERIEKDLGRSASPEHQSAAERIEHLRKVLTNTNETRDAILRQMKDQPFMEFNQRQRYKKALPAYDAKIKRLKLDISAAETILKMSSDDLENPTIKPHYQHYSSMTGTSKPDAKK
jgi:chemotaxis protein CheX